MASSSSTGSGGIGSSSSSPPAVPPAPPMASSSSTAPAKVVYKRYDPSAAASLRNKRVSQLGGVPKLNGSSSGAAASTAAETAERHSPAPPTNAQPTRILGAARPPVTNEQPRSPDYAHRVPRSSGSSDGSSTAGSVLSAGSSGADSPMGVQGVHIRAGSNGSFNNGDYFAARHNETTTPSISLRGRERDLLHGVLTRENTGYSTADDYSPAAYSVVSSAISTPSSYTSQSQPQWQPQPQSQPHASSNPGLSTFNSTSSISSIASGVSSHASAASSDARSIASTLHASSQAHHQRRGSAVTGERPASTSSSNAAGIPLPRAQSAMAQLQATQNSSPPSSSSTGHVSQQQQQQQQYRPFIPPSAYVSRNNSAASSPGLQGPMSHLVNSHMANQISSAFARGLNNVNGVVSGNSSVKLPASASNVANAVWNKLPPAVQALKHENWDNPNQQTANGSFSPHPAALQNPGGNAASPPHLEGTRSLSLGAVVLGSERDRDGRPGSSTSVATLQTNTSDATDAGQDAQYTVQHTSALPIAAQLRLEVANQSRTKGSAAPHPRVGREGATASHSGSTANTKAKTPYKPGYQPKIGVWRDRTATFMVFRHAKNESGFTSFQGPPNNRENGTLPDPVNLKSTVVKSALEEERLLRRLDKLVELHFPMTASNSNPGTTNGAPTLTNSNSSSSLTSDAGSPLKASMSRRTSDMFGRVIKNVSKVAGAGQDMKAADQAIVKWQDDGEVQRCPICFATFNLITRKHHCRLCGRVVCFLPPNADTSTKVAKLETQHEIADGAPSEKPPLPTRTERCSTFVLYEPIQRGGGLTSTSIASEKTQSCLSKGTIREVDLGDSVNTAVLSLPPREREAFEAELEAKRNEEVKKGVRICRDCVEVVQKRQKKTQPRRIEGWLKLYQFLNELQKEIEAALPILSDLRSISPVTVETVKLFQTSRKTLLQNLSSYDLLAKRIRDLPPTPSTPLKGAPTPVQGMGSSQDRLQKAIYSRAMLFLGEKMAIIKNMGGLQVELPPPPPAATPPTNRSSVDGDDSIIVLDGSRRKSVNAGAARARKGSTRSQEEEEARAAQLAVLYEQEALVSGYLDDANARRQFEDAAALKTSLDDLRKEIASLLI